LAQWMRSHNLSCRVPRVLVIRQFRCHQPTVELAARGIAELTTGYYYYYCYGCTDNRGHQGNVNVVRIKREIVSIEGENVER